MRILTGISAIVIVTSFLQSRAFGTEELPNPNTCGASFPQAVTIQHHGRSFIAKKNTYTLVLDLSKPGALNYRGNWSTDVKEGSVNSNHELKTAWDSGFLQYFIQGTGDLRCANENYIIRCAHVIKNLLQRLEVAEAGMVAFPRSPYGRRQKAAIDCATSITLGMISKAFDTVDTKVALAPGAQLPLDPISHERRAFVTDRLDLLRKAMPDMPMDGPVYWNLIKQEKAGARTGEAR